MNCTAVGVADSPMTVKGPPKTAKVLKTLILWPPKVPMSDISSVQPAVGDEGMRVQRGRRWCMGQSIKGRLNYRLHAEQTTHVGSNQHQQIAYDIIIRLQCWSFHGLAVNLQLQGTPNPLRKQSLFLTHVACASRWEQCDWTTDQSTGNPLGSCSAINMYHVVFNYKPIYRCSGNLGVNGGTERPAMVTACQKNSQSWLCFLLNL